MARAWALAVLAVIAPTIAAAEQIVVVSEARTSPHAPLGGRVRVIHRIEGSAWREESSVFLNAAGLDTAGRAQGKTPIADPADSTTSVWFPQEGMWRMWSTGGKQEYSEISAEDLSRQWKGGGSLDGLRQMFGGNPNFVSEIGVSVDSSAAETMLLGLPVRPYAVEGILRFAELESNLSDSLRFVRRAWLTPAIPGVGPVPRETPAGLAVKLTASMQFFPLPMLDDVMTRLEEEVGRLAGYSLRDEVWIALAGDLPGASDAPPDSATSDLVFHREVLEIRREPSDPGLFRVPPGYVRSESADSSKAAPRGPGSGSGR